MSAARTRDAGAPVPEVPRPAPFGAPFLIRPDPFFELVDRPWGRRRLALSIAGIRLRFRGFSDRQHDALSRRYRALVVPAADRGPELRIFRAASDDFRPYERQSDLEASLDLRYEPGGVRLAGLFLLGRLERREAGALAGSLWLPPGEIRHLIWAIENYLRVFVAYRLVDQGGFLLHAAAVGDASGVDLFYGHSGAGKTTLARRAAALGLEVLSDDLNLVVPEGRGYRVHQLPYAGEHGRIYLRQDALPLRRLYRLDRRRRRGVSQLGPAQAIGGLLTCSPFVNADPWWRDRLLHNLAAAAAVAWPRLLSLSPEDDLRRLLGWGRR